MKLDVFKIDGTKTAGKLELPDNIFSIEPNNHVLYLAVKSIRANRRAGTHKAKERSEVRGGGRKPWKQKGRGTARAGTIRSPLWVGGGTIFGPRPRKYTQKLNKKVNKLARASAYSFKAKSEQIVVVEDLNFERPNTKEFAGILNVLNLKGKRALFLTNGTKLNVYKSGRNIPGLKILEADKASAYDVLNNQVLILEKGALESLENSFN